MYQHTEEFLHFINPSGALHELRAQMDDAKFISGRFDDMTAMARNAVALQLKDGARAAYYSLNSLTPGAKVGARDANTMKRKPQRGSSASDCDILYRVLYLIDIDPERPSGVCSTADEKAAALAVAKRVQAFLTAQGWPEPILIDSGNGYHLLYRAEHATNPSSAAWAFLLKHLAKRFDTKGAKVDTSVFNPGRICRLPGTWNRKGADTPERPHRMARVLSYPIKWEPVLHGPCIHRMATDAGYDPDSSAKRTASGWQARSINSGVMGNEKQVMALIAEYPRQLHLCDIHESDGRMIISLEECPFVNRAHAGGKSAFVIHADGHVSYSCFAESCPGKGFASLLRLLKALTGRASSAFPPTEVELTPRMYAALGMSPDWAEDEPEVESLPLEVEEPQKEEAHPRRTPRTDEPNIDEEPSAQIPEDRLRVDEFIDEAYPVRHKTARGVALGLSSACRAMSQKQLCSL